jgi:hypothetical protein
MDWIKHHKLMTAGLVLGGLILYKIARNNATAAANNEQATYGGPSIIGAPGPVVTMPTNTDQTETTTTTASSTDPLQLAQFISGEVEKARQSANVANTASATTTNVDLMANFLTKIKPGKLAGQKIDLTYNDTGQVTSFGMNSLLKPLTLSQQAKEQAKATGVTQKSILAGYKSGFMDATGAKLTNAQLTKLSVTDYLAALAAGKKTNGAVGITQPNVTLPGGYNTGSPAGIPA